MCLLSSSLEKKKLPFSLRCPKLFLAVYGKMKGAEFSFSLGVIKKIKGNGRKKRKERIDGKGGFLFV